MSTDQNEVTAVPTKKRIVKRRAARQQVKVGEIAKKAPEQTGQTFNVWYGKWAGGDKYDSYNVSERAPRRLVIATDAGYTRADTSGAAYCCLFFAKGVCPAGSDCTHLHRLPPPVESLPDSSRDVFGREKHSDYRDDMGGVGSFSRMNRTLYVGRIKETRDTAEMVERHFEEFGEIERIKILTSRGVAFVTYFSELNAQFAKEAMSDQSLDQDEILNVRWSTEDPNPTAKVAEKRYLTGLGEAGIAKGLDPEFVQTIRELDELEGIVEARAANDPREDDGDVRSSKRARIEAPVVAAAAAVVVKPQPVTQPSGLLSANAMDSLKFMASIAKQSAVIPKPASAPVVTGGLGGLADYGSDDE